jgi:hypothetical protein
MITEQELLCVNFFISQESFDYEIQQHLPRVSYVNPKSLNTPLAALHILLTSAVLCDEDVKKNCPHNLRDAYQKLVDSSTQLTD